jgi:drug/metabolite transporter (DMT)-like permease
MATQSAIASARPRSERLAVLALFVGAAAIAFSPIFVRLSELGPTATAFHRVALAIPVLWLALALDSRRRKLRPLSRWEKGMLLFSGIAFSADLAFWHWSLKFTSVANATLFANFTPIFVTIGAYFFLKETIRPTFLVGLGLSLAGAALLVSTSLTVSFDHLIGDGLGVVTAMFYGTYIVIVARLRGAIAAVRLMLWTAIVTSIVLLPVALLAGESVIPQTPYGWLVLLGLAWGSHAAGQSLIAYALAHLPASFSSVALLIQPVGAALLAWLLLAEPLGLMQALGGAVVLAGVLVARLASRPA